jgi:dTDP-4-amino-4,6-dideoxygalactose transaminase
MIPRAAIPISNKELFSLVTTLVQSEENEIIKFEKDLANYLGVRKVYGVNSGRTALYLALKSLGLKPKTGVIVPAYVCPIVFEVILRSGLKPILVDVDPKTYNINPELIPDAITSDVKAIIPVHLFGRPSEVQKIMEIANKFDLFVIEDVAQALGSEYEGRKCGTFGDLAVFSFGPGKSITSGEGGALAVNRSELIDRVENLRSTLPEPSLSWRCHVIRNLISMKFFSNPTFYSIVRDLVESRFDKIDLEIIENSVKLVTNQHDDTTNKTVKLMKMPSLSAKMARMQLRKIDELNNARVKNAILLFKMLEGITHHIQLPEVSTRNFRNIFTRFPVKVKENIVEKVRKDLKSGGIDVERPYHYLLLMLKVYKHGHYSCAKDLCKSLITIPNHPCLNSRDIIKISHIVIQSILSQTT